MPIKSTIPSEIEISDNVKDPAYLNLHYIKTIFESGDMSKSETICRNYLNNYNASSYVLNLLGAACYGQGKLNEAITYYEQAIVLNPKLSDAYNNRGVAFHELGEFDKALESYNLAINVKPDYAGAYNNRGITYNSIGSFQKSLIDHDKAIQYQPNYPEAFLNLGKTLKDLGEVEKAIEKYLIAIQLAPGYAEAYNNLANALKELGQLEEAVKYVEKAILLKPDYQQAYRNLGHILKGLNRLDQAMDAYNKALELDPNDYFASHMVNSMKQNSVNSSPRGYVETLFNQYARNFDDSLVNKLEYNMPNLLMKSVNKAGFDNLTFNNAVDMGCGTGLAGVEFRDRVKKLVGIDLSKEMIKKAHEKNIYDELVVDELVSGLDKLQMSFDLFVSADVFIYVGELQSIFQSVNRYHNNKSLLVFSTEDIDGDTYELQTSGRFAHSKGYVLSVASLFNFQLIHFERANLRKESNKWIIGGIYIFEIP